MRTRRHIKSNSLYEITFRAIDSLPLTCTRYMSAIIYSVLSRVQRDHKVVLHHFIFEGSHPHIVCTAKDADQCQRFYGQLQKQLTDCIKKLCGLDRLKLWEGRANINEIPTLDDAIAKIGYLYANPSNDNLEDTIEKYPGVSSWRAFLESENIEHTSSSIHNWIRLPSIEKLPARSLSRKQDVFYTERLIDENKATHVLEIEPLSWAQLFLDSPNSARVDEIKSRIIENVRKREFDNRTKRISEGKTVLGAEELRKQPMLKAHTPKKKGHQIFVQSMFKEIRLRLIYERKELDGLCREIYDQWKRGDFNTPWPPGTFPPPLPPLANFFN